MHPSDPLGLVGETVADKYVVESVVGAGGFATVYRARHTMWHRPVALKVFNLLGHVTGRQQRELVDAFLREGAILAELSERSPAICQARDAGTLTSPSGMTLPYLVLEWLDGSTLADLLDVESMRGRVPRTLAEAVDLLDPIAEALALAHQRGIVHRDVKPANIFVVGDATETRCALKLLDFGVAKVRSSAEAMASTAGSFAAFTPSYAAPEQFSRNHGATGPWTDVYALSLVLVELVTGQEAQGGADLAAVAKAACDAVVRPTPRGRGAEVSDAAEVVFERALAVRPRERYPDVAALWGALRAVLARSALETPAAPRSVKLTPRDPSFHTADTLDLPGDVRSEPVPSRRVGRRDLHTTARRRRRWRLVAVVASTVATAVGVVSARSLPKGARAPQHLAPTAPPQPSASSTAPPEGPCPADMALIPGGSFFMGDDDGTKYERPAHQVLLPPYCMDRFEVTVAKYKACSDAGECKRAGLSNVWAGIEPHDRATFDPLCNATDPVARAQHPINCVDWEMASRFCETRGKRLPSEAEWEFAARGPDGRRYPWGDAPPSPKLLNACGTECEAWGKSHGEDERAMYSAADDFATTAPVGSFPAGASPYGLEDVAGNVWEWTADWFAPYDRGDARRPSGPRAGTERVIRGGAWNGRDPSWVRPTFRYRMPPSERSYGTGFRCASDPAGGRGSGPQHDDPGAP